MAKEASKPRWANAGVSWRISSTATQIRLPPRKRASKPLLILTNFHQPSTPPAPVQTIFEPGRPVIPSVWSFMCGSGLLINLELFRSLGKGESGQGTNFFNSAALNGSNGRQEKPLLSEGVDLRSALAHPVGCGRWNSQSWTKPLTYLHVYCAWEPQSAELCPPPLEQGAAASSWASSGCYPPTSTSSCHVWAASACSMSACLT